MVLDNTNDEDDDLPSGGRKAGPDDFEDKKMGDSDASDWTDEQTEKPSEAIKLPDWLTDAVGIGSKSPKDPSIDSADEVEDISRDYGDESRSSEGGLPPDWLSEVDDSADVRPSAASEKGPSEATIEIEIPASSDATNEDYPDSEPTLLDVLEETETADQWGGARKSTEDAMNDALEDPGIGQDDERDDLDGELKWLEELAASQDASDDTFLGAGNNLESLGALADEDFIPDWLREDVPDKATNRELSSLYASETVGVDIPDLRQEGQTVPSQDVPDWLTGQMGGDALAEQDKSEDIDWFNQIIAGDESAIDELLEVQAKNLMAESPASTADTSDDQPSWLRELEMLDAAGDDIPEPDPSQDEIAPPAIESEPVEWQPLDSITAADEVESLTPEDVPTDPEEAMAWLEQLALDQGVTSEELTSEVSDLVPDEFMEAALEIDTVGETDEGINLATEVPDDPDEAMDWLERLAAEQGASEDELMTFIVDTEAEAEAGSTSVDIDEELKSVLSELTDVEMPADSGEALYWLEELAMGTDIEQAEDSTANDEQFSYLDESVVEIEPEEVQTNEDLPSDFEAAQIAAMMSEAAGVLEEESEIDAELESISESIEDTLIITTLADESEDEFLGIEEVELDQEADFQEVEEFEVMEEADFPVVDEVELVVEADSLAVDEIPTEADVQPLIIDEVDDDVDHAPLVVDEAQIEPEVEIVDEDEDEDDDLAWLDSLDEANVTGWLRAEEAILAEEQSSTGELTPAPIDFDPDPDTEDNDLPNIPDLDSRDPGAQLDVPGIPELSDAQAALHSGQITEALNAYSALVDSGESLPYVIADLEGAVETYRDEPGFMKLLGDAYSRNGQLQKAIEIYRLALNNL
jgi:tetratricopeptide (TPR) repeat protein